MRVPMPELRNLLTSTNIVVFIYQNWLLQAMSV